MSVQNAPNIAQDLAMFGRDREGRQSALHWEHPQSPRRAAHAALGLDLCDVTALLARIDDGALKSVNQT